jgi:hypothetical protein
LVKTHSVEQNGDISIKDPSGDSVPWVTLRRAPAPSVEPEGAAEAIHAGADPDEAGVLRQQIDRDSSGIGEHQVMGSIAAHLVGEVGPVG